jgi:transcriptional regulator with XRE-family HTH domain
VPDVRRPNGSPTLRRRELGFMLRTLRNERGLTVDQVAAELLCSPSKVSRMETGQRGATPRDIRDLCILYGVTEAADRERLTALAKEGKEQGWWQNFSLPHRAYVGLEQEASSLSIFQSAVVPGILQVADYTRAVHRAAVPPLDDSAIEERVEERHTRQQILSGENLPVVEIILDEPVTRRPVGGPGVMREQLNHIIDTADRPNVTVRIVPFEAGAHPALESNFTILNFNGQAPTVVHTESIAGQMYLERQPDIERLQSAFKELQRRALSPKDSIRFLEGVRDSYTSDLTVSIQPGALRRADNMTTIDPDVRYLKLRLASGFL